MGLISRRFRWLQLLFPPAEAKPINPSFVSDDVVLVHQLLSGTEEVNRLDFQFANGAAGVTLVNSPQVPEGKFWYVPYASFSHDDTTARTGIFSVQSSGIFPGFAIDSSMAQNIPLVAPRPLLLRSGTSLRAQLITLLGTKRIQLSWAFLELDVGAPMPHM